jgi:O-antigen ligase
LSETAAPIPSWRSAVSVPSIAFVVVAGTTLLLPLFVDLRAEDSFRMPKELVFRAAAIALLVVFAFGVTQRQRPRLGEGWRRHPEIALALAAVAWTALTTLTSTNRFVSLASLGTVAAGAVLFIGTLFVLEREDVIAFDVALAPAIVNAIIVVLQEYGIWQPFTFPAAAHGHMSSTALIGNPNDVGAYLVVPAVAAVTGATLVRGFRRVAYSAAAVLLFGGIVASGTRTAMTAFVAAVVAFAVLRRRRNALVVVILIAVVAGVAFFGTNRFATRSREWVHALQERRYDVVFSNRLPPYFAAADMWREHPITGVGPGVFKASYLPHRLAVERRYPRKWFAGWSEMFGETHNDHLQILAETGIVGYALFLGAIAWLAWPAIPFGRGAAVVREGFREVFAHELRIPLAAVILVVAVGQFPLQIAAPRAVFIYYAAMCFAWDRRDA